jgi:hypothetical protein
MQRKWADSREIGITHARLESMAPWTKTSGGPSPQT